LARIKRIFLDLDDVLNEFTMEALRHVTGLQNFTFNPEWGYDIVRAANSISKGMGCGAPFTHASFWGLLERDFWANVGLSEWCHELIGICTDAVGRSNVCILSAPTTDPDCLAGKLEWVQREMPTWLHHQFLFGSCKRFCAYPGSLLIDDSDANIDAFRKGGGAAILFPRPWNTQHGADVRKWINWQKLLLGENRP